jgi:predicted Rossmann fold flavoprotein
MPELKKTIIIGGGITGLAAAYWCRQQDPSVSVTVYEKEPVALGWMRRRGGGAVCLGRATGPEGWQEADYPRGLPWIRGAIEKWPGTANRDWLAALDLPFETDEEGRLFAMDGELFAGSLEKVLLKSGVEIRTGYFLESISRQPDGSFRIWSKDGQPDHGQCLLLATGGERNHGMAIARELGAEERASIPAYVRLRPASPKLTQQLGPLEREIRLRWPKSGLTVVGQAQLSPRGLEGRAVSDLACRLCEEWKQRRYTFSLEVDWVPSASASALRSELDSRSQSGRRKALAEEPLFGFSQPQWVALLELSRIDPDTPWIRLKSRQMQMLVQRLKASSIAFSGMGLPAGERAWAGGIIAEEIDWSTCASRSAKGIYYAGEILDILGSPGGHHLNLIWATAYLAGSGMALASG